MGFAAVVLKEHARGSVQLAHDDPLGAVDHERPSVGHKRQFAHIGFVLAHLFGGGLCRFAIHDHQTNPCAQRGRIGETPLLAFFHVEYRVAELVVHKLKSGEPVMAHDRKY
jgi:hypothetical protein